MRLLLIRHGETALNAARILQPPDTPLSERGLAQAAALARRLAGEPIAALWSSDLPRAWQTAVAIASGRAIRAEPLLQERNFGDWRGQPYDSLAFDPLAALEAPPGGESAQAFDERIARAWAQAEAAAAELPGALALVTHGLVIRRLFETGIVRLEAAPLPARIGNTSLTVVEGRPLRASLVDCTAHLDAARADDPQALSGG
ncbi:MAG TPA: histidine phosphatase family protein [Piscinibacter sp.]|jgi:probable phosphoglycerate mutase|uniref:histidine phosphatase family protein n=1 Tax=Piscinibacter sp. TaxID=1903157 RepID=UPI002CC3ED30|nr:histidine phosphatase family protein [Piscinibacter sp.]HNK19803.1 histidine phosphatase family protein [Piscinibacter sp.]